MAEADVDSVPYNVSVLPSENENPFNNLELKKLVHVKATEKLAHQPIYNGPFSSMFVYWMK